MLEALNNFHFIRPWGLLLVPVVLATWWLWRRQSDPLRSWRAQMDPDLLAALAVDDRSGRRRFTDWRLIAWLLASVAIAGPTWRPEPSPFAEDAAPLMILLKAGGDIDRVDVPTSPLDRAKLKIADLAHLRRGEPLGLIAYAGSAHLVLPPTRDTQVVGQMAAEIDPEVMPTPGDRLDLAIRKASEVLASGDTGGTILVIADAVGEETDSMIEAWQADRIPVQFLALSESGTPEFESLERTAKSLRGTVRRLTADDQDVSGLVQWAVRQGVAGIGGESSRWQEAGFWLVPLIAILVALSFRRESTVTTEAPR